MDEKQKGELVEAKFITEALERKYIVSSPFGDSCEYDFIVDCGGKFYRVQVKSIFTKDNNKDRYMTKFGHGAGQKKPYENVDFGCLFVAPENAWYIIPFSKLNGVNCCVYPHRKSNGIYEKFKGAWYLFTT